MSEHSLPENLAEWPEDPFQLFGIPAEADEKQLRRAYHRLLKKYKPEHAPDEFRRLNEAYESLRPYLRYRSQFSHDESENSNSSDSDWEMGIVLSDDALAHGAQHHQQIETEKNRAWAQAHNGELSEAREPLLTLLERQPLDEELVLRAFWLSRLAPKQDQRPLELLERYLNDVGLRGRVFQLYLMELDRLPKEVLSDSARTLLVTRVDDDRLTDLTRLSWIMCAKQGRRWRLEDDLNHLKETLVYDAPDTWRRLLFQAAEILVLLGVSSLDDQLKSLKAEIALTESPTDDWYEERWELVEQLFQKPLTFVAYDAKLFSFAKDSLLYDDWELRQRFLNLIANWVDTPNEALNQFDQMGKYSTVALYVFNQYAARIRPDSPRWSLTNYYPNLEIRVIEFIRAYGNRHDSMRHDVLEFCLFEDISLDEFLDAAAGAREKIKWSLFLSDASFDLLSGDIALNCAINSLLAFHA